MSDPCVTPCPFLPVVGAELPITHTRAHRSECGEKFYFCCLELAQSQWLSVRPAQAILQLDKAMMAILSPQSPVLKEHPIPYLAIRWMLKNAPDGGFIGNPVRHFQHLASRMNHKQPQPELREARAWVCMHLAERTLGSAEFPRDSRQILKEALVIPNVEESIELLEKRSKIESEVSLVRELLT